MFPNFAGYAQRTSERPRGGYDIMRTNDSWLAARLADEILEQNASALTVDEVAGCWCSAFRGVLSRLNEGSWSASITFHLHRQAN